MKEKHAHPLLDHFFPATLRTAERDAPAASQAQALNWNDFQTLIVEKITESGYDERLFRLALDIKQSRSFVVILLGGTSGCGKSTLASLLASRLGITTVISTDHVRQLVRNFIPDERHILFSSSYNAAASSVAAGSLDNDAAAATAKTTTDGFELQNSHLVQHISHLIRLYASTNRCLIVEGVHLSVHVMSQLLSQNAEYAPRIFPFLIYISNRLKHSERFAIRGKYMTLEPRLNKYLTHFNSIRLIQDYLCRCADDVACGVPKVDNTNVDKSLILMHQTILRTLLSSSASPAVPKDPPLRLLNESFELTLTENNFGSKEMVMAIRKRRAKSEPADDPPDQEELEVEQIFMQMDNDDKFGLGSLGS